MGSNILEVTDLQHKLYAKYVHICHWKRSVTHISFSVAAQVFLFSLKQWFSSILQIQDAQGTLICTVSWFWQKVESSKVYEGL